MKNIITFCFFFSFMMGSGFAQNIKPKFEKQDELTKVTYYFDNGKIKETGFFRSTKLQGKWIKYNNKGEITTIANYENGKKEGKWFVLINNKVKALTYKTNKLIQVKDLQKEHLPFI